MKEELAKIHRARQSRDGKFSGVDLEEGEVVEVEVRRSKVGLVLIWAGEAVGVVLLTIFAVMLFGGAGGMMARLNETARGYLYMLVFMMYVVLLVSGAVGTMVYRANCIIVTNRRVIQRTTISLFARSVNVISLSGIEDVSFAEKNILDRLFHVGTLRLATVGEETTYTLNYVESGGGVVRKIVRLVHGAKGSGAGKGGGGSGAGGVDKKA